MKLTFFALFFSAFFCVFANAAPIVLEDSYLIKTREINASQIADISLDLDFTIDEFNNRSAIQLPALKLKRLFSEHGFDIEIKAPIVSFYYAANIDLEAIQRLLIDKFLEAYPNMQIISVKVTPASYGDLGDLEITNIDIGANVLRRNRGSFAVWFGSGDQRIRRVFFNFSIEANLPVIQATKAIANGAILSSENTKESLIVFDRVGAKPIDKIEIGKFVAKGRVKKGDIIVETRVAILPAVRKNSQITIEVVNNGVRASFLGVAQKDAEIGELISVKDKNKRVFTARVISKDLARIE